MSAPTHSQFYYDGFEYLIIDITALDQEGFIKCQDRFIDQEWEIVGRMSKTPMCGGKTQWLFTVKRKLA